MMLPDAPPTQRIVVLFEVKAVPLPIPMQLFWLGVPNRVPFETLYVCQPPNEPPLVPASVVQVRPPEVKVPPMPAFPPVESVVLVKLPVTLLVPTIASPPLEFEIAPLEFTCVHPTYANVELPVTVSPLVEVRPPVVKLPVIVEVPEDTYSPPVDVRP